MAGGHSPISKEDFIPGDIIHCSDNFHSKDGDGPLNLDQVFDEFPANQRLKFSGNLELSLQSSDKSELDILRELIAETTTHEDKRVLVSPKKVATELKPRRATRKVS